MQMDATDLKVEQFREFAVRRADRSRQSIIWRSINLFKNASSEVYVYCAKKKIQKQNNKKRVKALKGAMGINLHEHWCRLVTNIILSDDSEMEECSKGKKCKKIQNKNVCFIASVSILCFFFFCGDSHPVAWNIVLCVCVCILYLFLSCFLCSSYAACSFLI